MTASYDRDSTSRPRPAARARSCSRCRERDDAPCCQRDRVRAGLTPARQQHVTCARDRPWDHRCWSPTSSSSSIRFTVFLVALNGVRLLHDARSSSRRTFGSSASTAASPPGGCASITAVSVVQLHDAAALLTNNMGILWVASKARTLATGVAVSLYRTPESLEGP